MDIPYELRKEMDALSKEIFGVSSRWQKILKTGNKQLLTKTVKEVVPATDGQEATTKDVEVPVLTDHGFKQSIIKNYTLDEVHQMLLLAKAQVDAFRAAQKQQEEEKVKAEAEHNALKNLHESTYGSAVT